MLAAIFAAAFFARVVFFAVASHLTGLDGVKFAELADGHSYIATARSMAGEAVLLNDYDHRVFPGLPMLLAGGIKLALPPHAMALGLNWLADALVALLTVLIFREWRLGLAIALLPPTFLMESTGVASEPTMLVFTLLSLWLLRERRMLAAGLAVGFALAIRPMALGAWAGGFAVLVLVRDGRGALRLAFGTLLALGLVALWLYRWNGDPLISFRTQYSHKDAYAGAPFCLPLENFIRFTLSRGLPPLRLGYLWAHALVALAACGLLARELWREGFGAMAARPLPWMLGVWLALNTGVALCINGFWGVQIFPRLLVPALPALLYPFRAWLPRGALAWLAIAAASFAIGLYFFVVNQRLLGAQGP
jgi:hypothetical protein